MTIFIQAYLRQFLWAIVILLLELGIQYLIDHKIFTSRLCGKYVNV